MIKLKGCDLGLKNLEYLENFQLKSQWSAWFIISSSVLLTLFY